VCNRCLAGKSPRRLLDWRVRRLIVNADDFGFTAGVNRGIAEGHRSGIVTSSTLMANGPAFENAVGLANTMPRLSVGCHVVLIDGEPVVEAKRIPSLISKSSISASSGGARFRDGLKSFAVRALAGRLNADEIEAEAAAQIRKLQLAGIHVSHLDTHKHTHLFPSVLRPLLQAARSCGVQAVRNPFGPRRPLQAGDLLRRPSLWTRSAEVRILRTLAVKFRNTARQDGMLTPDGSLGVVVTGSLDEKLFRAMAELIPEGTWEFVCHPGYNDDDLKAAKTRLRESRETELRLLTMPEVRQILLKHGIELISYRDLNPDT
jgi:hopanoid biosynthesis associated protein HpnK